MNYNDIKKYMRVRPIELHGELDQIEALHLNPGFVCTTPMRNETYEDSEFGTCKSMIQVKHDDGRVMWHSADQLEPENSSE